MTPDITEFSYGFALTNELVGWAALHTAPIFPSLIEEGKEDGGYDVKLDMPAAPLYLQFKRSHYMSRRSAREIKTHRLQLSVPFYRFAITERKRSFQHTSLVSLDDGYNEVFYAAPRFYTLDGINAAWAQKQVAVRSVFVAPREIGLIDDDDAHAVAFDRDRTFFCSEPREIQSASIEQLRDRLLGRLREDPRPLGAQLGEWRERAREAGLRAEKAQAELEMVIEERRRRRLYGEPIVPQDWAVPRVPIQLPFSGRLERRMARRSQDREVMPIRPPLPLTAEQAELRELSDEARRTFNAQFFVVQPT